MDQQEGQPAVPDTELYQAIGAMSQEDRINYKRHLLDGISDREMICRVIDEVTEEEGLAPVTIIY